jgi:hypothetical protein
MCICLFKKKNCPLKAKNVQNMSVANGAAHFLGNKGSVSICFDLMNHSFCFIGAHLAAF